MLTTHVNDFVVVLALIRKWTYLSTARAVSLFVVVLISMSFPHFIGCDIHEKEIAFKGCETACQGRLCSMVNVNLLGLYSFTNFPISEAETR